MKQSGPVRKKPGGGPPGIRRMGGGAGIYDGEPEARA